MTISNANRLLFIFLGVILVTGFVAHVSSATDYYVSIETGKGKKATLEKPAKDLGNIIKKLEPGDVIHIAGGVYEGKGSCGHYKIEVPVKIIGGYSNDFSARDPWGEHKTIFSGDNCSKNFEAGPRLQIELHMKYQEARGLDPIHNVVVDGIIVDNSGRNQYVTDDKTMIFRNAKPSEGRYQTPGTPGIKISLGKYCGATVQNCVITNCAVNSADGALSVAGGKCSKVTIKNNLIINNTGNGIFPISLWKPPTRTPNHDEIPNFFIESNTVLFSWKPGPIDDFAGSSMRTDDYTVVWAKHNVFAFNDIYGVDNIAKASRLELVENLITANNSADYKDYNTEMLLDDIEDEAEYLGDETVDNVGEPIQVPVPEAWANMYMSRNTKSRAVQTASVAANNSGANALRSMLGLPLQAGTVKDDTRIWLHRLPLDGAIEAGLSPYKEMYGCRKP